MSELTKDQMAQLDQEFAKSLCDWEPNEQTLSDYIDSLVHGIVTCKYPTTIPCNCENEIMALEYLVRKYAFKGYAYKENEEL